MSEIDPKEGFETEPEMIVTDLDLWVAAFTGVAMAITLLVTGLFLLASAACALTVVPLVMLWVRTLRG